MNPQYVGQPVPVPSKMPQQKSGPSGKILVIVALLVVAILGGVGLLLAGQDRTGPLSQRLTYRLEALADILADGKKNASSDKLRKVTGEASLLLSGDITSLTETLPKTKGKKPATIVAAESSKPSLERLKTAKVNGTYDLTYTSELTSKLETTSALIEELHKETRSKSLKASLATTYEHIAQFQKDLAAKD